MKSWKRAKCSGKTPLMAKEALKQHLMRSDFHKLSDEQATIVASDTDMKSCMMDCDDEEIDEKQVDEKKVKVEEVEQVDEKKVKDEAKSSSVVLYSNKKRKLDDSDLDKFICDATSKVQQGLDCMAIAKTNMLEAKLALQKIRRVVDSISSSRGSRD